MKILFLTTIPSPYQMDFINAANKHIKLQAYFLYANEKNRSWKLQVNNGIIANFERRLTDYLKFYQYFKSFNPDIMLIGGAGTALSDFAILISKLNNKRIVFWLERPFLSGRIKNYLKYPYLKIKLRFSEMILAIGSLSTLAYKKYQKKIYNFPYSMKLDNYYKIERSLKKDDNGIISFLFVGQFIERKNIFCLISAFKSVSCPDIRLNIVGTGELKDEILKEIFNDQRIKLYDFIQPAMLYNVYTENDILLLPSKHDGWGVVIVEAMAAAMPVIGTRRVGAIYEYIEHEQNGYICDIDEKSIKDAIEFYIANKKLICQHGIINRSIIRKSNSDVSNSVPFLIDLLRKA